jgi:uncharacterized repeat protein (TIGR01451 family)
MRNNFIKTILLLAFICLSNNHIRAQYVTIPNTNLRNTLMSIIPSCFNASQQMDTTCSGVLNLVNLDLSYNASSTPVNNLTGLKYFKNMKYLNCSNNYITSAHHLPPRLKTFICTSCMMSLLTLPDSIEYVDVGYNNLTDLMNPKPKTLKVFKCAYNNIGYEIQVNNVPYPNILPDSLEVFDCSYNGLTNASMPIFPSTLKSLICSNNLLDSIPPLPSKLNYLNISANKFVTLPNNLPDSLKTFYCSNNLITGGIAGLPDSLKTYDCSNNQITSITSVPPTLKVLGCSSNQLTSLPILPTSLVTLSYQNNLIPPFTLPSNLEYLNCSNTSASFLPSLPSTLKELFCSKNQLTSLPSLPNTLTRLFCDHNVLSSLPTLPNYLLQLKCNKNLLTSLPSLPNTLNYMFVDSNNISCLPPLPNIWTFGMNGNPITCVPNYISSMNAATLALPLCMANDSINNPAGCDPSKGILGRIYKDISGNCIYDNNEPQLKNIKVKFFNPITNQFGATYSLPDGLYDYVADPGTYFALIDTTNQPYTANCTNPGLDTIVVTTSALPLATNVNFGLSCKPGFDLNIQSVARNSGYVFPGQQHSLKVMVGDASQWFGLKCTSNISGQVQLTISGPITYNGPAAGSLTPVVNGNVYTYDIADFSEINNATDFVLLFTTDTTAQLGDFICVHSEITPTSGDNNPLNNINDYCYIIKNSYDPNYKEVYPTDVLPLYQDWFTYTIHFQNLGTAPAINIRLRDTLDTNLDAETFEVINYSHYNTVTLMNGILDFRFPNILLPDSASNPAGSQGFVQYRIKPKANLIAGTQIENTAHIYFDYNPAVVTNTTVNNFITTVGNATLKQSSNMKIYPNPSNGIFTISAAANIEVYNLIGDLILLENNTTSIDLTAAPKGMYFVKLNGGKIEKLIKN